MDNTIVAENYFRSSNEILGLFSFTIGLACLSTNSQSLFGFSSCFFVLLAWWSSFQGYKNVIDEMKNAQDPALSFCNVIKRCWVAVVGFAFLAAVSVELVDTNGFSFF